MLWTMENMRALSHIEVAEFDKAVEDGRLACRHPNTVPWSYLTLISALSNLDREDEAREVRDALFERWPDFPCPASGGRCRSVPRPPLIGERAFAEPGSIAGRNST